MYRPVSRESSARTTVVNLDNTIQVVTHTLLDISKTRAVAVAAGRYNANVSIL
jgi:hypothetical protein